MKAIRAKKYNFNCHLKINDEALPLNRSLLTMNYMYEEV